jgi:hypothetical protein
MTPEMVSALVPFGIAGLAIAAVLMLAMFPKNGRAKLLVFAILVICVIFAYDRYLQNDNTKEFIAISAKLQRIAQEVRSMDTSVIAKLRYESRQDFPLEDLKAVTHNLCENVMTIYKMTDAAIPVSNCQAVIGPR